VEERTHRLSHALWVKLNAKNLAAFVLDGLDDAVRRAGRHRKIVSEVRNGLEVAGVDLNFVSSKEGVEPRGRDNPNRVGRSVPFLAV
jgi:hypothetical protein